MLDPSLIPLVQRLDRDADDREALETLVRELEGRAEHEVLARLLERVAARRRTPEGSAELMHRAALTWSGKVGDDGRALPLWTQVLEAQPEHEGALLGMATIYRRTGRAEQAEAVYRRLLAKAVAAAKKVPLLESLATLLGEREQPEREIEARRELAVQRGAGAAATSNRRALAKLLVERARRRAAASPLAEGEVDPDRREAAGLLGAVAREGATGRATEFAQAALTLWPGDEGAFDVLEESGALKQSELTTLRIEFLAANPRGARGQRVRRDLAEAYVATQRTDDAIAVLAAAVDDDPQAAQALAKLYERLQRHLDLAQLLDRLPTPGEADARQALLRRRAAAWRATGQKGPHLAALRALLDECPADAEALAEVERDCRLQGLLGELRDRLRAAAAVPGVEAAARVRWLREVAQLAERRFDDTADARAAWEALERATDKADERAEAQEALVRLMARNEDWDLVLERLAAQAEAEPDASEARRRWMRWAQVRREHRPDPAREVAVLEKLWAQHPDEDAVGRALAEARRRAGDDLGVTEVLYALIERAGPANAASRWCQLAEHLERAGDLESSAEAWHSARSIDPTSALAWEAEARLLGARGDRVGQLTALVAYADHPMAAGRRAGELYARAAQLAFELGRKEQAGQLAERALRFAPDDDAMRGLVATLADPGTAPVDFEALLAELAEAGQATDSEPTASEEHDVVEEPTGIVTMEHDVVEEPTGIVTMEYATPEDPAELPDDLLEEIVPERVAVNAAIESPVSTALEAAAPPASLAADHDERTPSEGVRLPEAIAITSEIAVPAPPAPSRVEAAEPPPIESPEPGSITAELTTFPTPSAEPAPPAEPADSDEDSIIIDESLFGAPPPAAEPLPPRIDPPRTPSIAAPPIVALPLPFTPPPVATPSVAAPPLQFNPPPAAAPPLQFNPQPAAAPPLQFNPQPAAAPPLQFNPQPAADPAGSGDPFGRGAGDWAVDASGDPFAQAPSASVAPPPSAPAPEPAPAVVVASFERVLLPMFEALIGDRRG